MDAVSSLENISREFERGMDLEYSKKKSMAKSLLNSAGIFVGVFLMFAVIVIVTTDVRIVSLEKLAGLGLEFILLLFCSYSMYVTCSDSGMRHGLNTDAYKNACKKFDEKKNDILSKENQTRMYAFCRYFVANELKNTKMNILAVVGYEYNEYVQRFLGLDKKEINDRKDLSKAQKKSINKANGIAPIRLTPEMILKRGRHAGRRSPLGMAPETKKSIHLGTKFVTSVILTLFMTVIVLDLVVEPTWLMVAGCMLKMLLVVMNGFTGYKMGYENIVFDTTNYMSDQTDLMEQAIRYFEDKEKEEDYGD